MVATILALAITVGAVVLGLSPAIGLAAPLAAAGVGLGAAAFILTRIPGLTGDSYGAINQLAELAVWLALLALLGAGYG